MSKTVKLLMITGLIFCGFATVAAANNLTISNVSMGSRDPGSKSLVVRFDVSWENSWKNKINHDAVWLTFRLNNTKVSPTHKKLCQIVSSGLDPVGTSTGSNISLEIFVPSDKRGAFIRRRSFENTSDVATAQASISINYDSCGFSDADNVAASVFGLEMVFIPQGFFYAGDNGASTASFVRGSSDARPWLISSESSISVTNAASNGFYYQSANNSGEYPSGSTFTIPASFPKGYNPFYVMKYELNEGQWVEFINSLGSDAMRAKHDLTDDQHKNTDNVLTRNTIACSGQPLVCSTTRPQRALTFLSWGNLAAFLDWAALRPATELEFEKIARGPVPPVDGEMAWGNATIDNHIAISGNEDGTEKVSTAANANYAAAILTGGDADSSQDQQQGALRNGFFAQSESNRTSSGASYYGVMELSGNVKEYVVTLGNSRGLAFNAVHGDGQLASLAGYEGNADAGVWPGMDADPTKGITGNAGIGFKGGSWSATSAALRISDRSEAALSPTGSANDAGGRGVRNYDGN